MQVVHNPGTPPDEGLASPGIVDIIVTCEEPFERYTSQQVQQRLVDYPYHRARVAHQVSGVPYNCIRTIAHEMRQKAAYVFATSLTEAFYESFGECWESFVDALEINGPDTDDANTS